MNRSPPGGRATYHTAYGHSPTEDDCVDVISQSPMRKMPPPPSPAAALAHHDAEAAAMLHAGVRDARLRVHRLRTATEALRQQLTGDPNRTCFASPNAGGGQDGGGPHEYAHLLSMSTRLAGIVLTTFDHLDAAGAGFIRMGALSRYAPPPNDAFWPSLGQLSEGLARLSGDAEYVRPLEWVEYHAQLLERRDFPSPDEFEDALLRCWRVCHPPPRSPDAPGRAMALVLHSDGTCSVDSLGASVGGFSPGGLTPAAALALLKRKVSTAVAVLCLGTPATDEQLDEARLRAETRHYEASAGARYGKHTSPTHNRSAWDWH